MSTVQLKRSAVASKVPLTSDLALGELAINTYDGKIFIKKDNGTQSIVEIGASGTGATNLTSSANGSTISVFSDTGTDAVLIAANSTIAGVLTAEAQTIGGIKTFSANTIFDGNIGAGITSPLARLHTRQTISSALSSSVILGADYTVGNLSHGVGFSINNNAASAGVYVTDNNSGSASLVFTTSPSYATPTNTERMRIKSDGNVGIGTVSPNSPLHVAGDIFSDDGVEAQAVVAWGTPHSYTTGSGGTSGVMLDYTSGIGNIRAFNNSSGTGTAKIGFITGGSERARIDENGNVGIGTIAPATKLDVAGDASLRNSTTATNFYVHNTYTDASNYERAKFGWNTNVLEIGSEALGTGTVRNINLIGGDVSISRGSNTVLTKTLAISGAQQSDGTDFSRVDFVNYDANDATPVDYVGARIASQNQSGAEYGNLIFSTNLAGSLTEKTRLTAAGELLVGRTSLSSASASKMEVEGRYSAFKTGLAGFNFGVVSGTQAFSISDHTSGASSLERMRIDSSGNVLIGTTTSTEKLTIGQGNAYLLRTGGAKLRLADENNEVSVESIPVSASSEMVFKTNATEKMRLNASGSLGIGTSSPGAKLHVAGDAFVVSDSAQGTQIQIRGATNTNNRLYLGFNTTDNIGRIQAVTEGTAFRNIVINPDGGNVGIGTSGPSAKLDVVGDIEINSNVNLNSEATTLATTTKTQISSFAVASFRSGKLIVQAYDSVTGEVQISELLVAHNGTTASATEYGVVYTGAASLVSYDVDISAGNVRLMATRTSANSTQYKVSEALMVA